MITNYLKGNKVKIIVRPNSKKTEIIRWDKDRDALRVNVKAHPEKGKANIEIVKFFSKKLKKKVIIKSGLTSKEKVLQIG